MDSSHLLRLSIRCFRHLFDHCGLSSCFLPLQQTYFSILILCVNKKRRLIYSIPFLFVSFYDCLRIFAVINCWLRQYMLQNTIFMIYLCKELPRNESRIYLGSKQHRMIFGKFTNAQVFLFWIYSVVRLILLICIIFYIKCKKR